MSKKYLSEFFGISERAIFENIKKLEEMGYIEKSKN
jgi:DNA-binding MarR family transcriptional regulator